MFDPQLQKLPPSGYLGCALFGEGPLNAPSLALLLAPACGATPDGVFARRKLTRQLINLCSNLGYGGIIRPNLACLMQSHNK